MDVLKKIDNKLPTPVRRIARSGWTLYRESQISAHDKKHYKTHRFRNLKKANKSQLEGKLLFHSHAVEKGLSHDDLRLGFGIKALNELSKTMQIYIEKGFDQNSEIFENSLSTIKAYIKLHAEKDYDISYIDDIFGDIAQLARKSRNESGGAFIVEGSDKEGNDTVDFKTLFTNRHSIRTYADTPVDMDKILNAIRMTTKTPSVCNRQAGRVHVTNDTQTIQKILKLQGGLGGYETPPVLIAVTTDTGRFIAPAERNQIYTDGGLLSMSLLLALEYEKIAACPLNAMLGVNVERKIKHLFNIPQNENVVMFISAGNFKLENNAPKSFRVSTDSIVTITDIGA